jgi:hypothetical protein
MGLVMGNTLPGSGDIASGSAGSDCGCDQRRTSGHRLRPSARPRDDRNLYFLAVVEEWPRTLF